MNRKFLIIALLSALFIFPATGGIAESAAPPTPAATRDIMYYWYTYPDDTYNDYASANTEAYEWWIYYNGVIIDSNPIGGTLIAKGYIYNNYPHIANPQYFLYAHFYY